MVPRIVWLVAIISSVICLFFWFRDVRRVMRERMSTVESAAQQLDNCRKKCNKTRNDPEATAVLERSENIYKQAVNIYNQTLQKPYYFLPAMLMGFHSHHM